MRPLLASSPDRRRARIGRYEIGREIAAGGMASVHRGRLVGPAGFAKAVAIKRLHPQFAKDARFVSMLLDEARVAARIHHPNVVAVLDVVVHDEQVYLVMEYVDGHSLAVILSRLADRGERMPPAIAVAITVQVLHGLHAAHEARDESGRLLGVIHRDVSPQNILVDRRGLALITDFGVAQARDRYQQTAEGELKGKVPYMSPEQVAAEGDLTPASDIYAAAAVLWEMVCGERLFAGTQAQILVKLLRNEVRSPREVAPELPEAFSLAILRGLSRAPEERYPDTAAMARAIAACGAVASASELQAFLASVAPAPVTSGGPELPAAGPSAASDAPEVVDLARLAQRHKDGSITFSKVAVAAVDPGPAARPGRRLLQAAVAAALGAALALLWMTAPRGRGGVQAQRGLAARAADVAGAIAGARPGSAAPPRAPALAPASGRAAPGRAAPGRAKRAGAAEAPVAPPQRPVRKDGLFDRD